MALERLGLAAFFTFDPKPAVKGAGKARDAMGRFVKGTGKATIATNTLSGSLENMGSQLGKAGGKLSSAARDIGTAMKGATVLSGIAAVGLGSAIKEAANFEQGIANVRAVMFETTDEAFAPLIDKAKLLGATTKFTAVEATQAMEDMGRAGFEVSETLGAIGPALNAATAEGADLAAVTTVMTSTIRGLGLEAEQAAGVANVLALTSARTNTNILELGEAMKFAAPQAKTLGIELPEVAAILGALGDAGIRGSAAGTSFTNMLVKLGKPSKKATDLMAQLNAKIVENSDGSLNMTKTLGTFANGLGKMRSKFDKAAAITEIFGIRGQKATSAFLEAFESGRFEKLTGDLRKQFGPAGDAAQRMADIKMGTLTGRMTLLNSAVSAFQEQVGSEFLSTVTGNVEKFTKTLSGVVGVMSQLEQGTFDEEKAIKLFGSTAVQIGQGITDALVTVRSTIERLREATKSFFQQFSDEADTGVIRKLAEFVTMGVLIAAAMFPFLLALGSIVLVMNTLVIPAVTALAKIVMAKAILIGAAFTWPFVLLAVLVAGAVALFLLFQDEIVQGFGSVIEPIKAALGGFALAWTDMTKKFSESFSNVFEALKQAFQAIRPILAPLFTFIGAVLGKLVEGVIMVGGAFTVVGGIIAEALGGAIVKTIQGTVRAIQSLARFLVSMGDSLALATGITLSKEIKDFAAQKDFTLNLTPKKTQKPGQKNEQDQSLLSSTPADESLMMSIDPESQAELGDLMSSSTVANANAVRDGMAGVRDELAKQGQEKPCVEVNNQIETVLDGKTVARSFAKNKQELFERAGAKQPPYQRRVGVEQGSVPTGGTRAG